MPRTHNMFPKIKRINNVNYELLFVYENDKIMANRMKSFFKKEKGWSSKLIKKKDKKKNLYGIYVKAPKGK